jgi:hypothetical protein
VKQLSIEEVIELRDRQGAQKLDLWDPTDEQWDRYGGRRGGEVVSLDAWPPAQRPPRARRNDSTSSHAAADRLERRGRAEAQMRVVLDAVSAHPGRSSRELAALSTPPYEMSAAEWYHAVARRLPELRRKGLVARSGDDLMPEPTSGEALRWWSR